jgi:hypothetical protein
MMLPSKPENGSHHQTVGSNTWLIRLKKIGELLISGEIYVSGETSRYAG